jgi:hypothetical protein
MNRYLLYYSTGDFFSTKCTVMNEGNGQVGQRKHRNTNGREPRADRYVDLLVGDPKQRFTLPIPSRRPMALKLTHLLTEMSIRNLPGG